MSLTVAVQMDPLAGINIAGDSTFSIMLGNGSGSFYYPAYYYTASYPQAVAIGTVFPSGAVVNPAATWAGEQP